jgi:hypothetical protein
MARATSSLPVPLSGHLRDERVELVHRRMPADDFVEIVRPRQLGAKHFDLPLERAPFERPARQREELVLLERLGQIVEGAELHGRDRGPHRLHGGDQDYLDTFVDGFDALKHLDAVHPG